MSTLMAGGHGGQQLSALTAIAVATTAGGPMDAWLYLAHGRVFATAQSANVVLTGIALAGGDVASAAINLPSLLAFITGAFTSRLAGRMSNRAVTNRRGSARRSYNPAGRRADRCRYCCRAPGIGPDSRLE